MRPKHWSHSALSRFEQCPRSWKHKYIDKLADPKGPALERGIIVHETLEHALRAQRKVSSKHTGSGWLAKLVNKYRDYAGLKIEQALHVDRRWRQVKDVPGRFIPPGTWATGKLDVLAHGFLADWKTGGMYFDKHEDQAELYALLLTAITGISEWECDLVYVDHEHVEPLYYDFSDPAYFAERKAAWEARVAKLYAERVFPKKPGKHCKWCPFHQTKGGPCNGEAD